MATETLIDGENMCECCQMPATTTDYEGVPLCAECWSQGCKWLNTRCRQGANVAPVAQADASAEVGHGD